MTDRLIFTALLVCLTAAMGWLTVQSGRLLQRFTPKTNLLLFLSDNLARLLLILVCVVIGIAIGPGIETLGWRTDRLLVDFGLGAVVGLLLAPAIVCAGNYVVTRWGDGVYDNRLLRAIVPVDRREWPAVVLALLPAALVEELLFRSMPLAGLAWLVSPWVLMWPLALVFGLLHWSQGEWGVVGTTLLGLVLSVLFLWSGSIWVSLATHWMLNVVEITIAQRRGLRPLRAD